MRRVARAAGISILLNVWLLIFLVMLVHQCVFVYTPYRRRHSAAIDRWALQLLNESEKRPERASLRLANESARRPPPTPPLPPPIPKPAARLIILHDRNHSEVQLATSHQHKTALVTRLRALEEQPRRRKDALLCFCFDNELDLLHVKLELLHEVVSVFVIAESTFSGRGLPKKAAFDLHKHEPRFAKFLPQIHHIIDKVAPVDVGLKNGWQQTLRVKEVIGDYLLQTERQNAVVFLSDMDEIPSVQAVEWARLNCCKPGNTLLFDMPYYIYGLHWLRWKSRRTVTLTVRTIEDERKFWKSKKSAKKYTQTLIYPPLHIDPGFHCSYCTGAAENVEKVEHTNLVDGPPILGMHFFNLDIFRMLKGCGVTPQGDELFNHKTHFSPITNLYPELNMNSSNISCVGANVTAQQWSKILPALRNHAKLKFTVLDNVQDSVVDSASRFRMAKTRNMSARRSTKRPSGGLRTRAAAAHSGHVWHGRSAQTRADQPTQSETEAFPMYGPGRDPARAAQRPVPAPAHAPPHAHLHRHLAQGGGRARPLHPAAQHA